MLPGDLYPQFSGAEFSRRFALVRAAMRVHDLSALKAFEARVGQKVNATTVYRLFHKHGMHSFTHPQRSRSLQGTADGSTSADR